MDRVEVLKIANPNTYRQHPETKFLNDIIKALKECTKDPTKKDYLFTSMLPKELRHWKRIKKGMPNRYRLFFQYQSSTKIIVYVWINGAKNIRREGHKNDVYKAFITIVNRGDIPNAFEDLRSKSTELSIG